MPPLEVNLFGKGIIGNRPKGNIQQPNPPGSHMVNDESDHTNNKDQIGYDKFCHDFDFKPKLRAIEGFSFDIDQKTLTILKPKKISPFCQSPSALLINPGSFVD